MLVIVGSLSIGALYLGCATPAKSTIPPETLQMDRLFETCRSELSALPATALIKKKLPDGKSMTEVHFKDVGHLSASEKDALIAYTTKRKACWAAHQQRKAAIPEEKPYFPVYELFEALRDQNTAAIYQDQITIGQYNANRHRIVEAYRRDLLTLQSRIAALDPQKDNIDVMVVDVLSNGALQLCQKEMDIDHVIDPI
jgi:hypothetical protein